MQIDSIFIGANQISITFDGCCSILCLLLSSLLRTERDTLNSVLTLEATIGTFNSSSVPCDDL
jgi:hypothetical protein